VGGDLLVREIGEVVADDAVVRLLGEVQQVAGLLTGDAGGAEGVQVGDEELLRAGDAAVIAVECEEAALDRGGGGAGELLVEDGLDERIVGATTAAHLEGAGLVDGAGEDRVGGAEVGGGDGRVVAVGHGTTLVSALDRLVLLSSCWPEPGTIKPGCRGRFARRWDG
jgi:hypothetical protein